jgi:hypothetical protein
MVGRSFVIHILRNGFLFVGVEPAEEACSGWRMAWATA